jgi:hypothetical protein
VCPARRASPPLTAPSRLVDILGRVSSLSALVRMAAPPGYGKSWDAEAIETELRRLVDQFGRWPTAREPRVRASTASTARLARRNAGARAGRAARRPGPGCRLDRRPDRDRLTHPDRPPPRMGRDGRTSTLPASRASTAPPEERKPGRLDRAPRSPPLAQRFRQLLLAAQSPSKPGCREALDQLARRGC